MKEQLGKTVDTVLASGLFTGVNAGCIAEDSNPHSKDPIKTPYVPGSGFPYYPPPLQAQTFPLLKIIPRRIRASWGDIRGNRAGTYDSSGHLVLSAAHDWLTARRSSLITRVASLAINPKH